MTVRYYSSVAPPTTLSSSIISGSGTITVASTTGFPALTPYTLSLSFDTAGEELVQVEAAGGTTLTVTRGIDGTSATSHNAGVEIRHVTSARDFADSRSHENADSEIHGLAPGEDLVGTTGIQTLSNKTLTAPVLTGGTLNGNFAGNPNFTGAVSQDTASTLRLNNVNGVTLASTNHAFQIGPSSGGNLRLDTNEMQAVNNGVVSSLGLNTDGGNINVFNDVTADSLTNVLSVNGTMNANLFSVNRTSAVTSAMQTKSAADVNQRWTLRADGLTQWGDGTAALDTNLYRSAANVLKTDDQFESASLNVSGASTLTGTVTANTIQKSTGIQYKASQQGTASVSFLTETSFTQAVVFPITFPTIPNVQVNINSGLGETARWCARAIAVATTGFTLFVFRGDNSDPAETWSSIPVQWLATQA